MVYNTVSHSQRVYTIASLTEYTFGQAILKFSADKLKKLGACLPDT